MRSQRDESGDEKQVSVIAGVGEKNFGTQWRQGNRVHDSNALATALGSSPVGNAGGETNLYAVPICNVNPSGNGMNGVVYDACAVGPTLTTNKGEGNKVAVPVDCIDDTQGFDGVRVYEDEAPTLRSQRGGLKVALPVLTPDRAEKRQNGRRFKDDGEPMFTLTGQDRHGVGVGVLRTVRSDYGKEIRKQYEAGELDISRHEFLEHDIREDGITNTLSTVQKDNLLAVEMNPVAGYYANNSSNPSFRRGFLDGCFRAVKAEQHDSCVVMAVGMSANNCTEGGEISHCLNANDQRKVFGANQTRTMVAEKVEVEDEE